MLDVSTADEGARLDVFLARELRMGRRHARRLLERGIVQLHGRPAPKGVLLRAGDRVEVGAFRHPDQGPLPDPDAADGLRIVARDAAFVAIDKPAGMSSHPLDPDERGTALGAVLAIHPEVGGVGSGLERGLVHRLDRDTSGVLVAARTPADWARAREAFADRRVGKRYLARVHGRVDRELELEMRMESRGARVRVVASGGRASLTRVVPLEPGSRTSLVQVEPVTGLRHQIRVALARAGHPVVGDALYGSDVPLPRHLLHAAWIRIDDFEAEAAPPPELEAGAPR